jgi:hypothetical protein
MNSNSRNGWRQTHSGWHGTAARAKAAAEQREARLAKIAELREVAADWDSLGRPDKAQALRAEADRLESNL